MINIFSLEKSSQESRGFSHERFNSRLGRAIMESKNIAEFNQRIHFDYQRDAEAELILKNIATPTKFKKLKELANKFIEL